MLLNFVAAAKTVIVNHWKRDYPLPISEWIYKYVLMLIYLL